MDQYGLSSEESKWLSGLGLDEATRNEVANKISRIHAEHGSLMSRLHKDCEHRIAWAQAKVEFLKREIESNEELRDGGPR